VKIKALRDILRNAGATSQDTHALEALLEQIDEADIAELVSAITPAVAKVATSLAKRRRAAANAEAVITQFVTELQNTKLDNAAFAAVVDRIKKTKAIKLGDATEIANRYLSDNQTFKSKPEAAKAILKRQISDKRASERQAGVSGLF
jgi:ribosomal protein L12E/L44/L45/RPP1/RPP2